MNKKISALLILLLFVLTGKVSAQAGYEDVVYLKNGSVVHGMIVEQVPNESVKIQTKGKDVFVFKMDEIEKITKEKLSVKAEKAPESNDIKKDPYTGYSLTLESHLGEGTSKNALNETTIGMHVINGITINSAYSLGVGIGFDIINENRSYYKNYPDYYNYNHEYLVMTYFIDARAFPIKSKISPMIILDYGYSAGVFSNYITGGFLLNAGVGTKLNFTRRLALNLSLTYKVQQLHYKQNDNYYNYNGVNQNVHPDNFSLQYLCLAIGITL